MSLGSRRSRADAGEGAGPAGVVSLPLLDRDPKSSGDLFPNRLLGRRGSPIVTRHLAVAVVAASMSFASSALADKVAVLPFTAATSDGGVRTPTMKAAFTPARTFSEDFTFLSTSRWYRGSASMSR